MKRIGLWSLIAFNCLTVGYALAWAATSATERECARAHPENGAWTQRVLSADYLEQLRTGEPGVVGFNVVTGCFYID